jgi:hypothetical protein
LKRFAPIDFSKTPKLIVGEGQSDRSFFDAFCRENGISGFAYAHTGMRFASPGEAEADEQDSSVAAFGKYLEALQLQAGFEKLTDIVVVADTNDRPAGNPDRTFKAVRDLIEAATYGDDKTPFVAPPAPNAIAAGGVPRVHVLLVPWSDRAGGIETLCMDVAAAHAGDDGKSILKCVEGFEKCIDLNGLTSEKQDKFRLQSFLSGSWKKRPTVRAEQIWGSPKNTWIPLTHDGFKGVRDFLKQVEAL